MSQIAQEEEVDNAHFDQNQGIYRIETLELEDLAPIRLKGPRNIWVESWTQVAIVDCKDLDDSHSLAKGFDQILQNYGSYECPDFKKISNQTSGNKIVVQCNNDGCSLKIEVVWRCDLDLDNTKLIGAQEDVRAYLFWISINKLIHDCVIEKEDVDVDDNQEQPQQLNHPRERINLLFRPQVNGENEFTDHSKIENEEVMFKFASIDHQIMPDIVNLQKVLYWKYKINTVKELIEQILWLFLKWAKYEKPDSQEFIYDPLEIRKYLMKSCFWLTGMMGASSKTSFESQCKKDVEIVVYNLSNELGIEQKLYKVLIPSYNDALMKRLYDNNLVQFIKAAIAMPIDRQYEWIADSLPLRKEITEVKPTCKTFTIQTDLHGKEYKHYKNKEYKDDLAQYHKDMSCFSALLTREKLFDQHGKLDSRQMLLQKRQRIEDQIENEEKIIKDEQSQLKTLADSIANRLIEVKQLKKDKTHAHKTIKKYQIFKERFLDEDEEINKQATMDMLEGFRKDAALQSPECLARFNQNCGQLCPNFLTKTYEQLQTEDIPSESQNQDAYLKEVSTGHLKKEKQEQKKKSRENLEEMKTNMLNKEDDNAIQITQATNATKKSQDQPLLKARNSNDNKIRLSHRTSQFSSEPVS